MTDEERLERIQSLLARMPREPEQMPDDMPASLKQKLLNASGFITTLPPDVKRKQILELRTAYIDGKCKASPTPTWVTTQRYQRHARRRFHFAPDLIKQIIAEAKPKLIGRPPKPQKMGRPPKSRPRGRP